VEARRQQCVVKLAVAWVAANEAAPLWSGADARDKRIAASIKEGLFADRTRATANFATHSQPQSSMH